MNQPGALAQIKLAEALEAHQGGCFADAARLYGEAIVAAPGYFNAAVHFNHGSVLQTVQRLDDAVAAYTQAIALQPDFAEAYHNRATSLQSLRRFDEALADLQACVRLKPDFVLAYHNLGNVFVALRRWQDALASFTRATELDPAYVAAHHNRGAVLLELERREEAIASFDAALALKPDYIEAQCNRAFAFQALYRLGEAVAGYARALELNPGASFLKGQLLHAKTLACDWEGLAALYKAAGDDLRAGTLAIEPFALQGISDSEEELRLGAELYVAARFPQRRAADALQPRVPNSRIKVGYVCGEFGTQATSILMTQLLELHDKSRFEIFAFDNGADDGSTLRRRITQAVDHLVGIANLDDASAADLIRARGIDILINLNGYFGKQRQGVFSHRAAPIQVNYLGFPGTLGASYIDYIIVDNTVIPADSHKHYVEKVAALPHCYQVNDRQREVDARTYTRQELGLPAEGFVFCCFNNPYKILPQTFDVWMRLLSRVPKSVLWLLAPNATAATNLRKEAAARGVDGGRLIFAQYCIPPQHLARLRVADLFLDTLPYNAHTTASDALWMNVPVLTCTGTTFAGRVATSLLRAMGMDELVTSSYDAYENRAAELATDPAQLARIKAKMARNRDSTPLFDTPRITRDIERLYTLMHERALQGLPPAPLKLT